MTTLDDTVGPPTPAAGGIAEVNSRAAERAENRLLIGGELVGSESGEGFDNVSPATGEVIGKTYAATRGDMDRAIGAARAAFDKGSWARDRDLRARCLFQLHEALSAEREDIRTELIAEAGAPFATTLHAQLDWPLADALTYPAELIGTFAWERQLAGPAFGPPNNKRVVVKEPVGVVAAITPWNFPFEIIVNKLAQALATGNTVVLKPDPNTPWSATRFGRLIAEHTDIPPGVVNVVPTPDNSIAREMVTDPRVDMVSFTGSTAVGTLIQQEAAASVKRVFLELGGKSALIILDDADLAAAIPAAAAACVHAGQACAVTTRLLVPAHLYADAVDMVTELYRQLPVGDPASPETIVGPVINYRQRERILGMLQQARADGGTFTVGGGVATNLPTNLSGGCYVQPTVITGLDNSSAVAQQEIFGPVLTVTAFDDDDDAVRIANDSVYGLSGNVFSASTDRALAVAHRIRAGSISVNGGFFYGSDAPFGGYKTSGQGRQNGLEGFEQHLESKSIGYV